MSDVLLLGDSHVARIRGGWLHYLEHQTSCRVTNAGVGGARSPDLARQLRPGHRAETVVVSVGTNDAAPWKQIPVPEFKRSIKSLLGKLTAGRVIYIAPPEVDEHRLAGPGDRTNEVIRQYAAAASEMFAAHGGVVLETVAVLSVFPADVYEDDGVHLNGRGYARLLAELAPLVNGTSSDQGLAYDRIRPRTGACRTGRR